MTTEKVLLTAEDLLKLPDDGKLYKLLDGELSEMSPPSGMHGKVMAKASHVLLAYVDAQGIGEVLCGAPGIILRRNPDRVRAPDVCFFSRERLPVGGIPSTGYPEIAPDFVIEIVSPDDRASEVQAKVEEWLRAGARLVWTVYPQTRSIVAFRGLDAARVYSEGEQIDAAPVLTVFSVKVADLLS